MNIEIITIIGTGIGIVGFVYTIIRNFRTDFDNRFDKMEQQCNLQDQRWIETNKRMDGVYHILLKRIKEE